MGANRYLIYGYRATSNVFNAFSYFKCGPGIKPFTEHPATVWIGTYKGDPKLNFDDIEKKCDYEVNVAAFDTSRPPQERAVYFGMSNDAFTDFANTVGQMGAIERDKANSQQRKLDIETAKIELKDKCIAANGFNLRYSSSSKDIQDHEKNCKDIDNILKPCIISS